MTKTIPETPNKNLLYFHWFKVANGNSHGKIMTLLRREGGEGPMQEGKLKTLWRITKL